MLKGPYRIIKIEVKDDKNLPDKRTISFEGHVPYLELKKQAESYLKRLGYEIALRELFKKVNPLKKLELMYKRLSFHAKLKKYEL